MSYICAINSLRDKMQDQAKAGKVLIFIVAYNAEQHIEKVLNRIPSPFLEKHEYEILIIDDSSEDKTYEVAKKYQQSNLSMNLRVLYNPINQGYGGNQKLGYRYAITNGFDAVVLLHGDGQYAPELVEEMVDPLLNGEAEAVFGSRMINKRDALKGGMPYYKFIGNIILTKFQNWILNSGLYEFHSGYRAYSVTALERLPFERNSNDFHFDTQIIIQLLLAKFRIKEIPIPTFYGDEICHVNGIKYAWNVVVASLQSKLHKMNIFYKIEYDVDDGAPHYQLKLGYTSSHTMALKNTPAESRVLDLGAGTGLIAKELKKKGCKVTGLDMYPQENNPHFEEYFVSNLDSPDFDFPMDSYDVVLMLDIIEHVNHPEYLMDFIRSKFHPTHRPKIIMTTPNIAFMVMRFQLLLGNFNYGKKGILDRTHKRLFTYTTFLRMCKQTGYLVKKVGGVPAPFPEAIGNNWLGRFMVKVNNFLIKISKRFFAYQIYVELEPTPVVEKMLKYSITESDKKAKKLEEITKQ